MSKQIVVLENEELTVGIAPACGGSVAYFKTKKDDFDIFRHASATTLQKRDSNSTGMFPMLPFTHRIKGGKFVYWGITRYVLPNHVGIVDPIHGDGWKAVWTVKEQTPTSVSLEMSHDKAKRGYPFSYKATLVYTLSGRRLSVKMTLENDSGLPMPCGVGVHPFFTKMPDMQLRFVSKSVWSHLDDPIDKPYATPDNWSFSEPKKIKDMTFDTCFGGCDGQAEIIWPKAKKAVHIVADIFFGHMVLYTPLHKGFICLEPSTMANNAFNLAAAGVIGTGIQSIGPHEAFTGQVHFDVRDLLS